MPRAGAHLELTEALLLEQRVGHGDEKEIERETLQEARDHADEIDARPMAMISPRALRSASTRKPPPASSWSKPRRHILLRPVLARIEVVDQQGLDAVEAEPREAHLVALEHAIARIVEARLERQPAGPGGCV